MLASIKKFSSFNELNELPLNARFCWVESSFSNYRAIKYDERFGNSHMELTEGYPNWNDFLFFIISIYSVHNNHNLLNAW